MKRNAVGVLNGNWRYRWHEIEPPLDPWKERANDQLIGLMDIIGDEEARKMTDEITGSWREIHDQIKALKTQVVKAQTIAEACKEQMDDFLNAVGSACDEPLEVLHAAHNVAKEPEFFEWICPACGMRLPSTEKFCPNCGGHGEPEGSDPNWAAQLQDSGYGSGGVL